MTIQYKLFDTNGSNAPREQALEEGDIPAVLYFSKILGRNLEECGESEASFYMERQFIAPGQNAQFASKPSDEQFFRIWLRYTNFKIGDRVRMKRGCSIPETFKVGLDEVGTVTEVEHDPAALHPGNKITVRFANAIIPGVPSNNFELVEGAPTHPYRRGADVQARK